MFSEAYSHLKDKDESLLVGIISEALFEVDPMNTGCVENDLEDEYDYVAVDIYESVELDSDETESIYRDMREVFEEHFFSFDLEEDILEEILVSIINKTNKVYKAG